MPNRTIEGVKKGDKLRHFARTFIVKDVFTVTMVDIEDVDPVYGWLDDPVSLGELKRQGYEIVEDETIQINGRQYNKSEVLKAIRGLEEVG